MLKMRRMPTYSARHNRLVHTPTAELGDLGDLIKVQGLAGMSEDEKAKQAAAFALSVLAEHYDQRVKSGDLTPEQATHELAHGEVPIHATFSGVAVLHGVVALHAHPDIVALAGGDPFGFLKKGPFAQVLFQLDPTRKQSPLYQIAHSVGKMYGIDTDSMLNSMANHGQGVHTDQPHPPPGGPTPAQLAAKAQQDALARKHAEEARGGFMHKHGKKVAAGAVVVAAFGFWWWKKKRRPNPRRRRSSSRRRRR